MAVGIGVNHVRSSCYLFMGFQEGGVSLCVKRVWLWVTVECPRPLPSARFPPFPIRPAVQELVSLARTAASTGCGQSLGDNAVAAKAMTMRGPDLGLVGAGKRVWN